MPILLESLHPDFSTRLRETFFHFDDLRNHYENCLFANHHWQGGKSKFKHCLHNEINYEFYTLIALKCQSGKSAGDSFEC